MSGSGTTVKQTSSTLGPSERMVVDLGNLDRSVQNLPIGESGFVGSKPLQRSMAGVLRRKKFPDGVRSRRGKGSFKSPAPMNDCEFVSRRAASIKAHGQSTLS